MRNKTTSIFVLLGSILMIGFFMPLLIPDNLDTGDRMDEIRLSPTVRFTEIDDINSDDTSPLNKARILMPLVAGITLVLVGLLTHGILQLILILLSAIAIFTTTYIIGNHPVLEIDILQRFTIWFGFVGLALVYGGNTPLRNAKTIKFAKWITLLGAIVFVLYTTLPFFNQIQPGLSIFRVPHQIIADKNPYSVILGYGLILVIAGWAFTAVISGMNLLSKDLMQPRSIRHTMLTVWGWFFLLALFANYAPLMPSLDKINDGKVFLLFSVLWNFLKTAIYIFLPFIVLAESISLALHVKNRLHEKV